MKHLVKLARKFTAPVVALAAGTSSAFAQTATIPTASSMTTDLTAIGGVAATGAAIGFSIWLYRKVKSKAGQAVG